MTTQTLEQGLNFSIKNRSNIGRKMYLLDVGYNKEYDKISKWIKLNNGYKCLHEEFYPKIYISRGEAKHRLQYIQRLMLSLPYIKDAYLDKKKTWLRKEPEDVLCIEIEQKEVYNTASMLEKRGYFLYNVDINPVRQYLIGSDMFPMAKLKEGYKLDDDQWNIDYEIPDVDCKVLSIFPKKEKGIVTIEDPISNITLGDIIIDEGSESEIIEEFYFNLIGEDPDIILTENGDSFEFPYVYHRASQYGIDLQLGRDDIRYKNRINNEQKGNSYFSYGRIYYKPKKYTLSGRLHIDKSSFMYREGGMSGLIDLSRLTKIPLQEISRLSPGSIVSALQANQAMNEGILIQWKRNIAESWKTAEELLPADIGALILHPKVGLHEDVWELDFNNMFPNIMLNHNISPETVLCDCCSDSINRVPFINYNICEKHIGLIPRVLKPLIERRMEYKRRKKYDKLRSQEYESKQIILKWLLVTSFGYMGYNKARFGRIECYESITAYARDILLRTMKLADDMGFEILHGIVDCLWVKSKGLKLSKDPERLCELAYKNIGIPLESKARFDWIVFLPNKLNNNIDNPIGTPNRYYGLKSDGDLKIRGIEMRRSDTPTLIRDLQISILQKLAEAKTAPEFYIKIKETIDILREYKDKVFNNECSPNELIFETRISRKCDDYIQFNNQVAALKQFRDEKIEIMPGQSISYIITDHKSKDYRKRLMISELVDDNTNYDRLKYYEYLLRAAESILQPFGYTVKRLDEIIKYKIQTHINQFY